MFHTVMPTARRRRAAAVVLAVAFAASTAAATAAPAMALPPGPGQAGTPAQGIVLFHEDFENAPDTGPATALVDYVSDPDGYRYTAQAQWADPVAACNGFVLSAGNDLTGLCADNVSSQGGLRSLTDVLGQVNASDPAKNSAVAAYTAGPRFAANLVEFATDGEVIPLPTANRFVTFSVAVAATSCWASNPQLNFSVLVGGEEIPISGASINPCTDPRAASYHPSNDPDNDVYFAGNFASSGSFLTTGSPVGIVMRNASGATSGNDAAFDDIRLLDVTPQLDKAFAPARVEVGGTSTLTLTVTNTDELAAKNGWSFTDTFPAGLVVADTANTGGTCDAVITASAGGNSISVADGSLSAGEVSCTITVDVTSEEPRGAAASPVAFENCAANISGVIGLDLPGCASVEFFSTPSLAVTKTSDAVSAAVPGDVITYTLTATNTGTADFGAAAPAVITDDMTAVLDDADYAGDARADAAGTFSYADSKLRWSGPLPVGETVTITYTVTLGHEGDRELRNVLFQGEPTDPTPLCEDPASSPIPCDVDRVVVPPAPPIPPVDPKPSGPQGGALASTGGDPDAGALLVAGALLIAGVVMLLVRRRTSQ